MAFKTSPPDLAILDIKMPRMDGMEMLRQLRQTSDVAVIFLTCKNNELDEVLGFKIGADDFMHKPFSQRVLAERVKAVLKRSTERENSLDVIIERGALRMDAARHACTVLYAQPHSRSL